jgi:nondiscriminating glutamyl-tRNA synthetase
MKSPIAVRFAPSPTGPLHIGGVRTALYNYLFAKQHGGRLILRIEDTDQTRFVPGAEEYIIDALKWLGIPFNEGIAEGGDFGPYRQSDRAKAGMYQQYADQLLASGDAYYAFDTAEELDAMRERLKAAQSSVQQYNYLTRGEMSNSLTLSAEEVQRRLDAGMDHVIRMKMPEDQDITFQDVVRGEVSFHTANLDDKVLIKSDGMPTYHLANVVDDHLMEISHVIRGEEWLSSTPLHVALYRALGWESEMPTFVHLPIILKATGKGKLSKRDSVDGLIDDLAKKVSKKMVQAGGNVPQGAAEIVLKQQLSNFAGLYRRSPRQAAAYLEGLDGASEALKSQVQETFLGPRGLAEKDQARLMTAIFPTEWEDPRTGRTSPGLREDGYEAAAVLNFLVLLGWHPGGEQEVLSLDEMVGQFDLERVHKAGAKYDPAKLRWFNEQYLRSGDPATSVPAVRVELERQMLPVPETDFLARSIELMRERVSVAWEVVEAGRYLFEAPQVYDSKMVKKRWKADSVALLEELEAEWASVAVWEKDALYARFQALLEKHEVGTGKVLAPLRLALTGVAGGPGVFEIAALIGQAESLERLRTAREILPV